MENEAILTLLRSISTRLDNVATKDDIESLSKRVEEIEKDYQKHNLFINGNGVPGAKTRIALLESNLENLQSKFQAITDDVVSKITIRLVKIIGVPIVLSLILWVVKVIYDASIHMQLP